MISSATLASPNNNVSWRSLRRAFLIGTSTTLVVAGSCASALPSAAFADTLPEAIALAYEANPTLQSQRAQLRATDEGYVQAQAAFRPTISLTTTVTQAEQPQAGFFGGTSEATTETGQTAFSATQNLYTGGRATAQVSVAEAQIGAGREQLRSVEVTLLLNVVQAYCDVIRDRASLEIQTASLQALQEALDEIKARSEAGASTQTDVDQASAQVEATRAVVAATRAQLDTSTADYVAYVGQSPGALSPPPELENVPSTVDQAFDIAEVENPAIRQARFSEAATRAQIAEARAAQRPTVSVTGSYGEASITSPFDHHDYDHASSVSLNITQPIFTGGTTQSQIRQAIAQDSAQRLQIDAERRAVVQSIAQAWGQRQGAHLSGIADEAQVKVAQTTYDGMRVEYRAGLRETLDILIAEQTLTNARIALANARHDEYVASASLLGALGRLEAKALSQNLRTYEPQKPFRQVARSGAVPWEILPKLIDSFGSQTQNNIFPNLSDTTSEQPETFHRVAR